MGVETTDISEPGPARPRDEDGTEPDDFPREPDTVENASANVPFLNVASRSKGPPYGTGRPRMIAGYELIEEIARGGMGVVWKAVQRGTNRIVAFKMILHRVGRVGYRGAAVPQRGSGGRQPRSSEHRPDLRRRRSRRRPLLQHEVCPGAEPRTVSEVGPGPTWIPRRPPRQPSS